MQYYFLMAKEDMPNFRGAIREWRQNSSEGSKVGELVLPESLVAVVKSSQPRRRIMGRIIGKIK